MKIRVIGLGPGNPDYMLPIAKEKLLSADRVYGGKRHLETFDLKETFPLKMPLIDTINDIKANYKTKQVAVLVSGDTGFYSFLDMMNRHFKTDELETYPGISSLQYLFSKINQTYHDAYISSIHGRELDLNILKEYKKCGLLTDRKNGPNEIVKFLKENNLSATLYIGENLSYDYEVITKVHTSEYKERAYESLCVVVINFD